MPIDASIYNLIRPMQSGPDPLESFGRTLNLQNMIGQQEVQGLQTRQLRRGIEEEDATQAAYRESGGDPVKLRELLYGRGLYKPAQAVEKTALERDKLRGEIDKTKIESIGLATKQWRDLVAGLNPQSDMQAFKAQTAQLFGNNAPPVPDAFDPQWQQAATATAESMQAAIQKALDRAQPKTQVANLGGTSALVETNPLASGFNPNPNLAHTQTPDSVASVGATVRGQNMTDARTRSEGAANREVTTRGQDITAAREKDAPEALLKAAGYADRMQKAETILQQFAKSGKPTVIEAGAGGIPLVGTVSANISRTPARQQFHQAAEDWVRAKLRQESGAVIGDEEMAREIRTYFPMIGDSKEVVAQKTAARKTAEQAMVTAAGRAIKPGAAAAAPAGAPAAPQVVPDLPDPAQHRGYTATDQASGIRYVSDGTKWVRQ